jgi:hypothetical protein
MSGKLEITKRGYSKDRYEAERLKELAKCMIDPIYFIEKYVMIQHPIEGRVPFKPYKFQIEMIKAFHEHRNVICLTSRQMGKCAFYSTLIKRNGYKVPIGTLIPLTFKQRVIKWLEEKLVNAATAKPLHLTLPGPYPTAPFL